MTDLQGEVDTERKAGGRSGVLGRRRPRPRQILVDEPAERSPLLRMLRQQRERRETAVAGHQRRDTLRRLGHGARRGEDRVVSMRMQVDETWAHDGAGHVDHVVRALCVGGELTDLDDPAVGEEDVSRPTRCSRTVDDRAAAQQDVVRLVV
ncbi:MAG TPA: hypothetical protein VIL34_06455 [Actinopolymorphaceae bacterium]